MAASPVIWSYSRISAYLTCSLQFFFRYVARLEPSLVSSNLLLGSGVHLGHQLIYAGMQGGKVPPLKTVLDAVEEEIFQRVKTSPPIKFSNGGNLDTLILEARKLTHVLYESIELEEVVAVDHEETVNLVDGQGIFFGQLKVIYDLVVRAEDGSECIVDLKTAKAFPEERCKWDLQPSAYLYARGKSTGKEASFRYDVLFKKKAPEFEQFHVTRSQSDFDRLFSIIRAVERGIQSCVFIPNRSSISCSACGYQEKCSEWVG